MKKLWFFFNSFFRINVKKCTFFILRFTNWAESFSSLQRSRLLSVNSSTPNKWISVAAKLQFPQWKCAKHLYFHWLRRIKTSNSMKPFTVGPILFHCHFVFRAAGNCKSSNLKLFAKQKQWLQSIFIYQQIKLTLCGNSNKPNQMVILLNTLPLTVLQCFTLHLLA